MPVVWFKQPFYLLRPETTKHQSHCAAGGVFCDPGPLQPGQGEVSSVGFNLQPVQHVCLRWIRLRSFLHQEVLHAVCEQALGPVPPSDPDRAGQEEAELQGRRLVTSDKTKSITCSLFEWSFNVGFWRNY